MRFYHVTPISGPDTQAAKFLRKRSALVSFLAQQHLAIVLAYCASFILDSGAFSAWKKGTVIDFIAYIAWVRSLHLHPGFEWALIPDVIDGDEAANDALLLTWPDDLRGVPVWHLHESLERLVRLCHTYGTVAFGSSGEFAQPRTKKWWVRMVQAMDAICDKNGVPPCKLHGLRMMDPRIFTRLPFGGVDSSNVGINVGSKARFGQYIPPNEWVRAEMIADRIESFNSAPTWDPL